MGVREEVQTTYGVRCDRCGNDTWPRDDSQEAAESRAAAKGWKQSPKGGWYCVFCQRRPKTYTAEECLLHQYALAPWELEDLIAGDATTVAAMIQQRPVLRWAVEDLERMRCVPMCEEDE